MNVGGIKLLIDIDLFNARVIIMLLQRTCLYAVQ